MRHDLETVGGLHNLLSWLRSLQNVKAILLLPVKLMAIEFTCWNILQNAKLWTTERLLMLTFYCTSFAHIITRHYYVLFSLKWLCHDVFKQQCNKNSVCINSFGTRVLSEEMDMYIDMNSNIRFPSHT